MKKLFLSLVMMLSVMASFAQYEAGTFSIRPEVGINASSLLITANDGKNFIFGETNTKLGLVVGAEVDYQANSWFGISAGALYTQLGANGATGADVTMKYDYVAVPVLANFYPYKGLCLKTGIQPAFNIKAKATQKGAAMPYSDDNIRKFDFEIPIGISYEVGGFIFDARYFVGVGNILKNDPTGTMRNSSTQVTIGYKFHL